MQTKVCINCSLEKNINEFYYLKSRNKHQNKCKECVKKQARKYQQDNFEKIKKYKKEYFKKYREKNIEYIKEKNKKYRENHKEEAKEYSKKYRTNNREYFREYSRNHVRKRKNKKIKTEEEKKLIKLKKQIRCLISKSFSRKKFIKKDNTEKIIGCNFEKLNEHLLNTFKNNYGYEWDTIEKVHIDHIIPLAIAKTEEEVFKLCHYTNLQLLKAEDNMSKSSKLNWKLTN